MDLARRRALSRLLVTLVGAALASEVPASDEVLLRSGWPDEQLPPSAAQNRLRTAMSTLRKLGLQSIQRVGDGYQITQPVTWAYPS